MNDCYNTMAMSSTNQLFEFKPFFPTVVYPSDEFHKSVV